MLNWLSRIDRGLPKPRIVVAPMEQLATALYYCPWPWIETFNGKEYDRREGAIIHLNSEWQDDWDLECVLAHEWRHHWQFLSGIKYDGTAEFVVGENETHEQALTRFYSACKCERDALYFELRHAPGHWNQWQAAQLGRDVRRVIYSFSHEEINRQDQVVCEQASPTPGTDHVEAQGAGVPDLLCGGRPVFSMAA